MEGLSPKIDVVSILKYISEGSKLQLSWFSIKTGHREGVQDKICMLISFYSFVFVILLLVFTDL